MFQAKDIMQKELITVKKDCTIFDAVKIMVKDKISALPVVDDQMNLVGIITEKDMMKLLYNFENSKCKVCEFMTEAPITFEPTTSLLDICDCLINSSFRRVPIVSGKKLVGIISRRNVIEYICQNEIQI
jgi:CBS domain-containing protein